MKSRLETEWGFDGVIVSNDLYSARILIVKEGERTPYVYNKKRDVTVYVLQGVVHLITEGKARLLNEGERYHIPPKMMHRIHAVKGDATILEVGTKLSDEDVVVVEDDYHPVR